MTTQQFIDQVRGMTGLKPVMIEHLVKLAPAMSERDYDETVAALIPVHEEILKESEVLLKEIEKGEAEMNAYEKTELPARRRAVEDQEKNLADRIFDESASA